MGPHGGSNATHLNRFFTENPHVRVGSVLNVKHLRCSGMFRSQIMTESIPAEARQATAGS